MPHDPSLQQVVVLGTSQTDFFGLKAAMLQHGTWQFMTTGRPGILGQNILGNPMFIHTTDTTEEKEGGVWQ